MNTKVLVFNNTSLEGFDSIEEGLVKSSYEIVVRSNRISEINRFVISNSVDIVITVIDKNFNEVFSCVKQLYQYKPVPVVVFTYIDDKEVIRSAIHAGVSAYIVDGLQVKRILTILDTAQIRFKEQQSMRHELKKTKESLADRKVISRAKGIIMQQLKIDEETAYKNMRKMAMDKNIKLSELARGVISAAELMM